MRNILISILLLLSSNVQAFRIQQGALDLGELKEAEPGWLALSEISRIFHVLYREDRVGQYLTFYSSNREIRIDPVEKLVLAGDNLSTLSNIKYNTEGDILFPIKWVLDSLSVLNGVIINTDDELGIIRIGEVPYNITRLDMLRKADVTILTLWFTELLNVIVTVDSVNNELQLAIPNGILNISEITEQKRFGLVEEIKSKTVEDTVMLILTLGSKLDKYEESYTQSGYQLALTPAKEELTPEEQTEAKAELRSLKQIDLKAEDTTTEANNNSDTNITDSTIDTLVVEPAIGFDISADIVDTTQPEYNHPFVARPIRRIILVTTATQGPTNEYWGLNEFDWIESFIKKVTADLASAGYIVKTFSDSPSDKLLITNTSSDALIAIHLGASYFSGDNGVRVYYPELPGGKGSTYRMDMKNYERSLIRERVIERAGGFYLVNISRGGYALRQRNIDFANAMAEALGNVCVGKPAVYEENWLLFFEMTMPSIAVELGFVTNDEEAKRLNQGDYQLKLSQAITQGIKLFAGKKQ
jgi:hypothetical protein